LTTIGNNASPIFSLLSSKAIVNCLNLNSALVASLAIKPLYVCFNSLVISSNDLLFNEAASIPSPNLPNAVFDPS
jgi:hypothetical protein